MARRLLITYLTITALALAVVIVPLGSIFAAREKDRLVFDIERDAQTIASLVEDALEAGAEPSIDETLADYGTDGGRIVVVTTAGISVVDSDDTGGAPRDFSTRPEMAAALDGQRTSGTRPSETLRTDLMYVAIPVASGGTVHGAVRVTYPTSTLDARVQETWLRLGLLSIVVLAIVAAVGMVFARGVTRPVQRLQLAAGRLADGDLSVQVPADDGPPELRDLAETFNSTAARLAQLVESQQRFVADASHQLRTPLTALRLRLETLQPAIAPDARPKLDAAIGETNRLGRLVHSLLVLARSDATTPLCEPVDLTAAIRDRSTAWEPVAADDGTRLVTDCPDGGLWVVAVPEAVEQVLDNLVSNALAAAPPGSTVRIQVEASDHMELHVIDDGPGMTDEERARAFDRFWRPTKEARASEDSGFGLGLAIVHHLATLCGGTARLEPGPGGVGLDASVTFVRAGRESLPDAHLHHSER
ncbi:MAG TPA: ATP-binding protein [Acidimicrobiales bacterium]|nr:ATP-binding protein [Acidimicrobiales bacterium]